MFFYGSLHIDVTVCVDQQEFIYNSSEWTQDAIRKTCWEQWIIKVDGEKESGKSMLAG